MKKPKLKHHFTCPLYNFKVILILKDRKLLEDKYDLVDAEIKNRPDLDNKWYKGELWTTRTGVYIVWIEHVDDFYTMIHECLHLAVKILTSVDIEVSERNDEVLAHYQGYWCRKFWHVMAEHVEYTSKRKGVK